MSAFLHDGFSAAATASSSGGDFCKYCLDRPELGKCRLEDCVINDARELVFAHSSIIVYIIYTCVFTLVIRLLDFYSLG